MQPSMNIMPSMPKTRPKKKTVPAARSRTAQELAKEPDVKLPKTDSWLTRNEASDVLRCSPQTLKNYEDRKFLHPQQAVRRDRSGIERMMLVYNPKELAELPSRNPGGQPRIAVREPGEQAARAFEMFKQGRELDEIVIELRETPDRIDQLHERWLDHTRARFVITPEAKKAFEEIVGAFNDVPTLIDLVRKLSTA
jgi:hypothetical protein